MNKLVKLSDELLHLYLHPEKNETKILAAELEIDERVFRLYGIDKKDQKIISENFD